jgi:hypothetical protein
MKSMKNSNTHVIGHKADNNLVVGNYNSFIGYSTINYALGLSPSYTVTTSTGTLHIQNTTKYNILGVDVELNEYFDISVALYLSMMNMLGYRFYYELKKNNITFSEEIENIILQRIKVLNRDDHIEKLVNDK